MASKLGFSKLADYKGYGAKILYFMDLRAPESYEPVEKITATQNIRQPKTHIVLKRLNCKRKEFHTSYKRVKPVTFYFRQYFQQRV